jgi:serine/threonine protein phosphatase 1
LATRTLAFGDIHGCLRQFDALLEDIAPSTNDRIILLGDCVDRGPDSAGVLKRVLTLSKTHRVKTIMGNHEQMMLEARNSRDRLSDWLRIGGDDTLHSYAGSRAKLDDVPPEHWRYLEQKLVDYVETANHIFVHANAYPDMKMAQQPDYMLRWERCDNIAEHDSGKIVVCGHTPQKSGDPMNRGYAICIDTNACRGGNLTCLDADSGRIWQANQRGKVERSHISDFSD